MQRVELVLSPLKDGGIKPFDERFETCVHVVPSIGMRYQAEPRMTLPVPQAPKRKSTSQSGATGETPPKNPYSIEVLRRAIDILAVFSHAKPTMSLAEIVAAVQLPKTTVFRVLSSLVGRGYCELDAAAGKYSLGFELLRLADIRRRQGNVRDVAIPVMLQIRDAVNETVILSVRSGYSRVHIDFVEGLHPMRRMADLGVHAPLYAGAASKVLLAGMEDGEIEMYLKRTHLTAFQKTTITDSATLWREVNAIRKRGFAESKGELFLGGGALAAPIKDFFGATVAVMDILTPEHRYTAAHRNHCIDMLLDGSRRASERLGYRAGPPEPPAAPLRSTPRKRAPQLGS
jgi:DNA-binding IclR family transcriptional regulator